MTNNIDSPADINEIQEPTYKVRLPGFLTDEQIGLGDVLKRATSYVGVQPCGGCERRAASLNRWLVFTNRKTD
jgi:hypothetical protein